MYDKKLKRSKDGLFIRYIGRNQKGTPEKFRLGYDPLARRGESAAHRRPLARDREHSRELQARSGTGRALRRQKQSPKGMPPTLPKRDFEDPIKYVRRALGDQQSHWNSVRADGP